MVCKSNKLEYNIKALLGLRDEKYFLLLCNMPAFYMSYYIQQIPTLMKNFILLLNIDLIKIKQTFRI